MNVEAWLEDFRRLNCLLEIWRGLLSKWCFENEVWSRRSKYLVDTTGPAWGFVKLCVDRNESDLLST